MGGPKQGGSPGVWDSPSERGQGESQSPASTRADTLPLPPTQYVANVKLSMINGNGGRKPNFAQTAPWVAHRALHRKQAGVIGECKSILFMVGL